MNLVTCIQNLLYTNDCVIVPNFGAFITVKEESTVQSKNQIFLPPKKTLLFNSSLKTDDRLLTNYFSKFENIDIVEAEEIIFQQVNEWLDYLYSHEKLMLSSIGEIYLDQNKNCKFVSKKTENFLTDTYGLFPLFTETVINLDSFGKFGDDDILSEELEEIESKVINNQKKTNSVYDELLNQDKQTLNKSSSKEEKKKSTPTNNTNVWPYEPSWEIFKYALIGFVFISILSFSYINKKGENGKIFEGKFNPFGAVSENFSNFNDNNEQEELRMSKQIVDFQFFKDIVTDIHLKINETSNISKKYTSAQKKNQKNLQSSKNYTETVKKPVYSSEKTSVFEGPFFIIEGAYLDDYNANQRVRILRDKGFGTSTIAGKTRLGQYRVAFASFSTKEEAQAHLDEFKRIQPKTWIYYKND